MGIPLWRPSPSLRRKRGWRYVRWDCDNARIGASSWRRLRSAVPLGDNGGRYEILDLGQDNLNGSQQQGHRLQRTNAIHYRRFQRPRLAINLRGHSLINSTLAEPTGGQNFETDDSEGNGVVQTTQRDQNVSNSHDQQSTRQNSTAHSSPASVGSGGELFEGAFMPPRLRASLELIPQGFEFSGANVAGHWRPTPTSDLSLGPSRDYSPARVALQTSQTVYEPTNGEYGASDIEATSGLVEILDPSVATVLLDLARAGSPQA